MKNILYIDLCKPRKNYTFYLLIEKPRENANKYFNWQYT